MGAISLEALQALPEQLWTLLTDPISNLTASLVLYGIIAAGLLVLVLLAITWLVSLPDDEQIDEFGNAAETDDGSGSVVPDSPVTAQSISPKVQRPKTVRGLITALLIVAAVALVVWVTAGFTTASDAVCLGCHSDSPHAVASAKQPHAKTKCVACHEPGGVVGRLSANVPSRMAHFVTEWTPRVLSSSYGGVTQSACLKCHTKDIAAPTLNPRTGIRMSHTEPLAAYATCLDCHQLSGGVVGSHNAGMNPCLRCHDSKIASARCVTCHDKKAAAAARARTTNMQAVQVPEVRCGGCHNQKKECDSCHGLRMPHTNAFKVGAHARAGAVNFWYEGGRTCAKCHTPARRPCTKCHSELMGKAHGTRMATAHVSGTAAGCDLCHQRFSTMGNRDFCIDVCHTQLAKSLSSR